MLRLMAKCSLAMNTTVEDAKSPFLCVCVMQGFEFGTEWEEAGAFFI